MQSDTWKVHVKICNGSSTSSQQVMSIAIVASMDVHSTDYYDETVNANDGMRHVRPEVKYVCAECTFTRLSREIDELQNERPFASNKDDNTTPATKKNFAKVLCEGVSTEINTRRHFEDWLSPNVDISGWYGGLVMSTVLVIFERIGLGRSQFWVVSLVRNRLGFRIEKEGGVDIICCWLMVEVESEWASYGRGLGGRAMVSVLSSRVVTAVMGAGAWGRWGITIPNSVTWVANQVATTGNNVTDGASQVALSDFDRIVFFSDIKDQRICCVALSEECEASRATEFCLKGGGGGWQRRKFKFVSLRLINSARNGFNTRVGHSLIFAYGNRAGQCHQSLGFFNDLPFPPTFHSGAAPFSPQSPSSDLKTSIDLILLNDHHDKMAVVPKKRKKQLHHQRRRKTYRKFVKSRRAAVGVAVWTLAYYHGELCSTTGGVTPEFSQRGVLCRTMPLAGGFPGISPVCLFPCIPALLHIAHIGSQDLAHLKELLYYGKFSGAAEVIFQEIPSSPVTQNTKTETEDIHDDKNSEWVWGIVEIDETDYTPLAVEVVVWGQFSVGDLHRTLGNPHVPKRELKHRSETEIWPRVCYLHGTRGADKRNFSEVEAKERVCDITAELARAHYQEEVASNLGAINSPSGRERWSSTSVGAAGSRSHLPGRYRSPLSEGSDAWRRSCRYGRLGARAILYGACNHRARRPRREMAVREPDNSHTLPSQRFRKQKAALISDADFPGGMQKLSFVTHRPYCVSTLTLAHCSLAPVGQDKKATEMAYTMGRPSSALSGQCYTKLGQLSAVKRSEAKCMYASSTSKRARSSWHTATTATRGWNQWIEDGCTQRRAGTGPRNVTTTRDDRHLVRMAVVDRTASSTVLARHWSTATGVDLSASTVRRRLLRAGLIARMPLRRLPLSRNHKRLRLQWARERRRWPAIVDALWTAWTEIPQEPIQFPFDSMPRHLRALIAARVVCTPCWILKVKDHCEAYWGQEMYCNTGRRRKFSTGRASLIRTDSRQSLSDEEERGEVTTEDIKDRSRPGVISANHDKPESGRPGLDSNPCPPEWESEYLSLRYLAMFLEGKCHNISQGYILVQNGALSANAGFLYAPLPDLTDNVASRSSSRLVRADSRT
ncbi:hypothetical protein PR048_016228 [Dryococelus australis]|uniref:Transposase Tc1-like domain-containing protein n=1 Tax=Dryococelus australis TaxID=614101 RepID=A0ABQ9HJ55_9NEOP|nr:hypothetical protein PR048_016228 [Dryococelus australis]